MTLEEIYAGVQEGEVKELNLVIKADVQGSVEAVSSALERLENEKVKVRILHAGSGTITDSDVLLASASSAIVIGFNTPTQLGVERLAEREGVEIRNYEIIYRVIEDIEGAMKGILETTSREVVHGHAEVRAIFAMGKRGNIAGCMVTDGRLTRAALVRVRRDGQVIHDGSISSLRHFKEEVNEMAAGFECGVGVAGFRDFHEGDMLETYRRERARA
jgi:translation initiation factor IF-2